MYFYTHKDYVENGVFFFCNCEHSCIYFRMFIDNPYKNNKRKSTLSLFYSSTKDNVLRTFSLNQFVGLLSNTIYNVDVSVEIGGVFGSYGPVCTITTPLVLRTSNDESHPDFNAVAYPNPSSDSFKIDLISDSKEEIEIRVYDMLGKLIETEKIQLFNLPDYEVGAKYSSGVYSIVVTQAENIEVIKVIKR